MRAKHANDCKHITPVCAVMSFHRQKSSNIKRVCLVIPENLFGALESSFRRVQVDYAVSTKVCIRVFLVKFRGISGDIFRGCSVLDVPYSIL